MSEPPTNRPKCERCGQVHPDAGGYYDRIRCESQAAWARHDTAVKAGAPAREVQRLWQQAVDAGNTGD